MVKLLHGDCLELMKGIESGSVDLILTDPPYGTMKGINTEGWREDKFNWDTAIPPKTIFENAFRTLRPNGRLILFSQEPYTSELINSLDGNINFNQRGIWLKNNHANALSSKCSLVSIFEDVLIFTRCHQDFENKNPLRGYFSQVLEFIGVNSCKDVNNILGNRKAEHCFYGSNSSQFELCTGETYNDLIRVFGIDKMDNFKKYKELKSVNDEFKSKNLPTFNLPEGARCRNNVFQYPKDKEHFHPTQKPVALLRELIRIYSNKGDTILDFTMGSGSTGVACIQEDRNFIGVEKDDNYFKIAQDRINKAQTDKDGITCLQLGI